MDKPVRIVTELYLRRRSAGLTHKEAIIELAPHYPNGVGPDLMTLVRWEQRRNHPRGCHAQALESCHGVNSIAELGLGHKPGSEFRWTWATVEEIETEVARRRAAQTLAAEEIPMDRRTVVQAAVTGVGAAALLPVGHLTGAAQLLGGFSRIGLGDVVGAQDVATRLAAAYLADPSDETARAALAHARTLVDRLERASMALEVRPRLAAVASDAAALIGAAERSAGRLTEAGAWFDDALGLARQAGDRRLEALATADKAWTPRHVLGSGDRASSVEMLQGAAAVDRHLPAAARAYVQGVLTRELALSRDDSGSGHALERTLEAARLASREEFGWGYWSQHAALSGWDGARQAVYTSFRPLYLSRYRDAIPLLESALEGTPLSERRALLYSHLTFAWAGLGDRDQACSAGVAGLDQAKPCGLSLIRDDIRALREGFPPSWEGSAALAELDERLAVS